MSHRDLAALVDRWAGALRRYGAGPGRCVALWLPNSPEFVAAFLATLRVGATVAPLGVLLGVPEVRARMEISQPAILVTVSTLARQLQEADARTLVLTPDSLATGNETRRTPVARAVDDVAVLIFTSGTTGEPKAAELTHGAISWNARALADGLAMTSEDVQLAGAPLSHVLGMSAVMNATMISGGALAVMERFDAAAALRTMARTGATGVVGAPQMFLALLREATRVGSPPRLRFGMTGGAALPTELSRTFEATFGCAVRDGYGMSEVGGGITLTPVGASPRPHSVGPALPGSQLRIVDPTTRAPLPVGDRGEVAVRSPSVMRGYRGDAEGTRAVVDSDGWLLTGDIGYLDEDGYLFLLDRKKDLVIRSGYSIYPREVEEVVCSCPGVLEAAVVGIADDEHGEEVVALVVPTDDGALDPEVVKTFARARLAAYKYPRHVVIVTELPKGATGKISKGDIDRKALRARL